MSSNISVVIPSYNAALTIGRAIASVFSQTVSVAEIIVVDDASEDETVDVVELLAKQSVTSPIRIYRLRSNSGPAVARNVAWEKAKGEYLAFLDADDTWHPQKIQVQVEYVADNRNATFLGHAVSVSASHCSVGESSRLVHKPSFKPVTWYSLLMRNPFPTPSVFLKADVPARFNPDFRRCEDYNLWCELTLAGHQGYWTAEVLAFTHKPAYGDSGLSGDLWKMAAAQRAMYRRLKAERRLSRSEFAVIMAWSWLKLARRYLIVLSRT